jgi:predicted ABC-type transport system involved in lysophospholipase L1 biosynthesis ATPase subunit
MGGWGRAACTAGAARGAAARGYLLYRSCKEIGKTLILATHDHTVVQRADRIVALRDGAIDNIAPLAG